MRFRLTRRGSKVAVAAAVASTFFLAAGCSGGGSGSSSSGSESGSDGASAGSGSGHIQFFLSGDANQGGGFAKMAAKYKEETGVDVEIIDIANSDLPTRLHNSALANDLPALARVGGVDPVWIDQTVDLAPILDGSDIYKDLSVIQEDGKVVALPSDVTAVGMFINKDLFDKAGVEYPSSYDDMWTWDEFVEKVTEVQEKAGATYGMVMDRSVHRLKALFYEWGSDWWYPQDDGTWTTNDDTVKALEFMGSINNDTFMPRSVWLSDGDPNALFKSGDVAAYMSGSWQIADFDVNIKNFEWESVWMPYQTVKTTNYGNAAGISVFEGPDQEVAMDFLKWLYTPENYAELSTYGGFLPAIEGLHVDYTDHQEAFDLYNESISKSAPVVGEVIKINNLYQAAGIDTNDDPMRDEIIAYLNNEQTAEQTVEKISKERTDFVGPLP